MDRLEQAVLDALVVEAYGRLEGTDEIADHVLGCVMQQRREAPLLFPLRIERAGNVLHKHRVLRDGEGMIAARLTIPARHARDAMGDVLYCDVVRRRRKQIETAARQHPLPGAWLAVISRTAHDLGALNLRWSAAQGACRWQSTR